MPRLANHARLGKDRITGEKVLLAPETAITLNSTGTGILELCDGQRDFTGIVEELSRRFDAPPDALTGDVTEFLERLAQRGYLILESHEE